MRYPFNGSFRLTQGFGGNPAAYAKFGLKGHNGLDYGLPTGTPVVAPILGKVTQAGFDASGYGNYIKIENDKYGTVLAHLQSYSVKVGQQVSEGQQIGLSDNTGNSTGPHLHWGVHPFPRNTSNGYNGYIDQTNLIGQNEGGVQMSDSDRKALVEFDNLVAMLNQKSIFLPTGKREDWLDGKAVQRLKSHLENIDKEKDDLRNKLATCEANTNSVAPTTMYKVKFGDLVKI